MRLHSPAPTLDVTRQPPLPHRRLRLAADSAKAPAVSRPPKQQRIFLLHGQLTLAILMSMNSRRVMSGVLLPISNGRVLTHCSNQAVFILSNEPLPLVLFMWWCCRPATACC